MKFCCFVRYELVAPDIETAINTQLSDWQPAFEDTFRFPDKVEISIVEEENEDEEDDE